jgi:transcription elongation factor
MTQNYRKMFNPKNYTDAGLVRRMKIRNREINAMRQELGIEYKNEFEKLAMELGLGSMAQTLKKWKKESCHG